MGADEYSAKRIVRKERLYNCICVLHRKHIGDRKHIANIGDEHNTTQYSVSQTLPQTYTFIIYPVISK